MTMLPPSENSECQERNGTDEALSVKGEDLVRAVGQWMIGASCGKRFSDSLLGAIE
jgi:hypothetical protein